MPPEPSKVERPKRDGKARALAVKNALEARGPGRFTVQTPDGSVAFEHVQVVDDNGVDVVEVHAGDPENGDPHFRVINPPTYVQDPEGDVEVEIGGQPFRFREDPVAALAHVIAQHGGRMKDPRRGRT